MGVSVGGGGVKVGGGVKLAVREGGTNPVEVVVAVKVSEGCIVRVAEGMRTDVADGGSWLGVGEPVADGARRIATIPVQ